MDTTNSSENQQRRVEDRKPNETINWEAPGAPAVPLSPAASERANPPIRYVASLLVNSEGASVFTTPDAARLPHGHYLLSAGAHSIGPGAAATSGDAPTDLSYDRLSPGDIDHIGSLCGNFSRLDLRWTFTPAQFQSAAHAIERAVVARIERAAAPARDVDPEKDFSDWMERRGPLGAGAVPERIFFSGHAAGRRAAVSAATTPEGTPSLPKTGVEVAEITAVQRELARHAAGGNVEVAVTCVRAQAVIDGLLSGLDAGQLS